MARHWVLLVSADPAVLTALEEAMQDTGLHVTTSSGVAHAAAQSKDLRPALIISDSDFKTDETIPFLLVGRRFDGARLHEQVVALTRPLFPVVAAPIAEAAPAPAPAAPSRRRWVLLVSDEPELVAAFEEALSDSGLLLTTARDEAQAAIQARDLNLALTVSRASIPNILKELGAHKRPFQPDSIKWLASRLAAATGRGSL